MKNKNSFLRETHKSGPRQTKFAFVNRIGVRVWKEEAIPSPSFLSPLPDDNHSIRGCSYVFDYLRT